MGATSSAPYLDVLARAKRGRVVSLFAEDCDVMHERLEIWASTAKPPSTLVTLAWEEAPRLADELDGAVSALARAALTLYPALYASAADRERQPDGRPDGQPASELEAAASRMKGTSSLAVQRILESCRDGHLPLISDLPGAERVRQLSLALDPEQLVIELLVRCPERPPSGCLFAFGKGAEWVARNSGARVVIVVPETFSGSPELDAVTYGALAGKPARGTGAYNDDKRERPRHDTANDNATARLGRGRKRTNTVPQPVSPESEVDISFTRRANSIREHEATVGKETSSSPSVTVGAVIGRPHPGSDAEQKLHERLVADSELGPLFRFNQVIKTQHGTTPRVDLVWPDGKLVIEIDGHADHSRAGKFCHDRERDYQLLLTGYRVIRVPDLFVLMDTQLMLERIRSAVRYLKREKHGV